MPIEFDRQWRPIGPNKTKFISFVALQARSKPSITIKDWYEVDESVKDQIWNTIALTYNVPPSQALKDKLLSYCAERWTAFKTSLTKRFVRVEVEEGENPPNPCEEYTFLDEATWREFYRIKTTPEALIIREKAIASGRKNDCPHRLSRGGYEKLEEEMMKEKQKRRQEEAQSDPFTILSPPSPISREEKWRAARRTKTGEYTSDRARVVAKRIDHLQQEHVQGTFIPQGRNDILTVATGTPDHGGRVRGVGRGVGIRDYFGAPTRYASTGMLIKEEMELILENERKQMQLILENERKQTAAQMLQLKEEMMSILSSRQETTILATHSPAVQSTNESCVLGRISEDFGVQKYSQPCELYLEDPDRRLVALGVIQNLGPTFHHEQMQDDEVRVVVGEVKIPDAPVPFPNDEVKIVGEALKTFLRWPKRLVRVVSAAVHTEHTAPSNEVPQLQPQLQTQTHQVKPLQRLCLLAFDGSFSSEVLTMDPDVAGKRDIFVQIEQEDVVRMLMNDQITVPHVHLFMMYLHRLYTLSGSGDKFGFLCPLHIQTKGNTSTIRESYLRQRLCEDGKECYLAPYVNNTHWQLIVVCPKRNVVVFLCSLHYKPGKDLKKMMDTAMQTYQRVVNKKHTHELKEATWIQPKCRRQTGNKACGYYVMRHMLNIILLGSTEFTAEMFDITDAFSEEDIDDVRTRWANFFLEVTNFYCMRIMLDKVPEGGWTCEECALRTDAKKPEQDKVKETTGKLIGHLQCKGFGSSVNIESRSGSKVKIRSSCSGGKGTSDVTSLLPAKRHGALSQVQSVEKTKTIRVRVVPPRSPNMNKFLLQSDTSFNLKKGQMKAYKQTNSKPQISCNALETAEVPDYIWTGTFQLYSSEGLESSCDGIQAQLSTFASPKVLEAVDKLPEIIMLEQLPRLRTWPSQFVERQAIEDHIALYFFATDLDSYRTHYSRLLEFMTKNDLALRGNFDGDELLIFPSNLLPEQNQLAGQNSLLFLWGVFRGQKVGSSVPLPNSLKEENRSNEKTLSLDPNACPQAGEDTGGVDEVGKCLSVNNSPSEIHTFDSPGAKSSSVDAIILGGYDYSSDTTEVMQANDEGEVNSPEVDLDLSLHDGVAVGLSDGVGNHGNNEEAHEEPAREDDVEASLSGSNEQNLEIEEGMDTELTLERQVAEALILFSKGFGKI